MLLIVSSKDITRALKRAIEFLVRNLELPFIISSNIRYGLIVTNLGNQLPVDRQYFLQNLWEHKKQSCAGIKAIYSEYLILVLEKSFKLTNLLLSATKINTNISQRIKWFRTKIKLNIWPRYAKSHKWHRTEVKLDIGRKFLKYKIDCTLSYN